MMRNIFLLLVLTACQAVSANLVYRTPVSEARWQSSHCSVIGIFDGQAPERVSVSMTGSVSGEVPAEEYRPSSGDRIVLTPLHPFAPGEQVHVSLSWPGGEDDWWFTTRPFEPVVLDDARVSTGLTTPAEPLHASPAPSFSNGVAVPPDFPDYIIDSPGTPSDGNFFWASREGADITNSSYVVIMNNLGDPLFYWHWNMAILCPELQPNGLFTFATRLPGNVKTWLCMDETYALTDTFTVNGYPTDIHDISFRSNGNALLIGYDNRYIDMSLIVPGGNPNALVTGLLIQEQDENHMTVFEWSSFDHFPITDAAHFKDLTAANIDYVHCNSIEPDLDGNILISCNAMVQCVKIDATTGDIIWRFGGLDADTSHFELINDPFGGFSTQHDFKSVGGGHYSVLDNGRNHSPQVSRGLEYVLDTNAMTATLVWSYMEPGLYGSHLGSHQILSGGNHVIGWGDVTGATDFADISEVSSAGVLQWQMRFSDTDWESYRAYKFEWEGQAVVPYLIAEANSSSTAALLTYNVFGQETYDSYRIWQGTDPGSLSPILLTPLRQVGIWDLPQGMNYFAVTAINGSGETDFSNTDSVNVTWTGTAEQTEPVPAMELHLSPNPAVTVCTVEFFQTAGAASELTLLDLSGRIIHRERYAPDASSLRSVIIPAGDLAPGIYLVRVTAGENEMVSRMAVTR